ncbi:MAG: hypothetical protein JWM21_220 [Acidobacteria bacterium]|nr:hypothetical protein [Acidobacteriota bacterium]
MVVFSRTSDTSILLVWPQVIAYCVGTRILRNAHGRDARGTWHEHPTRVAAGNSVLRWNSQLAQRTRAGRPCHLSRQHNLWLQRSTDLVKDPNREQIALGIAHTDFLTIHPRRLSFHFDLHAVACARGVGSG